MAGDVDAIAARLSHEDLGERLRAVSEMRVHLDALEAELVAAAVVEGWSWTRVGAALGISKQAAHAKHRRSPALATARRAAAGRRAPEVSDEALRAVRLAREEAAALGEARVGTEHLLLGVLRMEDAPAAEALRAAGASLDDARGAALPTIELPREKRSEPPPPAAPVGPVSPLAREALERSLREALDAGEGRLGVDGLLVAVLRDADGGAARTLAALGVAPGDVVARLRGQR